MSTEASTVSAPAKRSNNTGCVMLLVGVAAFFALAIGWKIFAPGDSHTKHVTRSDYGSYWPLTVDSATIGCKGADPYAQVGSIRYGLNGTAQTDGYASPDPIWADDSSSPGLKVDIGVLRINALKLC